jgi:high-affinity Fe2+/Pb2+ permease
MILMVIMEGLEATSVFSITNRLIKQCVMTLWTKQISNKSKKMHNNKNKKHKIRTTPPI